MFTNRSTVFTLGIVFTSLSVFAQEDYTRFRSDATVQALGSFVTHTTQDGIQHGATDSTGILASYRYYFGRHNAVEVNYAWTSNTQTYDTAGVNNSAHEISAAYIFRMPMRGWSPFVLAGAGALVFDPTNVAGVATQTRPTLVYGAGADFNVSSHLFMRAEYRGMIYNSPTYDLAPFNGFDRVSHQAEPSIGFGWRF